MTRHPSRRAERDAARAGWGPVVPDLAACAAAAATTDLFLHLPKTAGSTVAYTVRDAPGWASILCYAPSAGRRACWCGSPRCHCDDQDDPVAAARSAVAGRHLQVSLGHATLVQLGWMGRALAGRGVTVRRTVTTVRPTRDRLSSMFRFYLSAALDPADDATLAGYPPAWRSMVVANRADVHHYLRSDGSIDGVAWFREFARSSGGTAFFLDDVFGSTRRLRRALGRGLVAVPDGAITEFCRTTYGVEPKTSNVSSLTESDPRIAAALAEAHAEIEACARRDDPYDAVLAEHLGDPTFAR